MAANSILKLKVDNTEYDANIKKAAEGIQHLAKRMHDAQGDFEGLDKASLDFIKDLQYMTTSAKTASGQYRELENAYKNLAATYEGLSAFEKEGDAGKALAEQLEILKKRTLDMKANMDTASKSLNDNGQSAQQSSGFLEALASKFTINIDALKLFDMGLSATKAALDVAKDAFFASETNVDEWGRTMAASQSLYEGFLTAINNGDISGYLSRMDEIVQAARAAYNELDTLGTMKTIQAPKMSAQQTENERMRMMIQTGRYIAPIDGRKASMQDGQLLTPAQIKTLERQLQNGMKSVVKLVGNEVKQTGKAIDAYYNSIAKQNGMSLQEFKKGTSSWDEFSKKMQGYQQYQKWRQENSFTDMYGNRQVREGNPYQEFKKWGTFRVDKMGDNSYNDLVRLIQQRDQQAAQAYGMQSQAYRTMNRAEGVTVRQLMGGGGGRKGGSGSSVTYDAGSLAAQQAEVSRLTKLWQESGVAVRDQYLQPLVEAEQKLQQMKDDMSYQKDLAAGKFSGQGAEGFREAMLGAKSVTETKMNASGPMLLDEKAMKSVLAEVAKQAKKEEKKPLSEGLNQLTSGLSGLQSGFAQLGIDLGDGFGAVVGGLQGITSILMAIQTIVGAIEAISAIDSLIPFAGGGIIKAAAGTIVGNSYSGDNMRGIGPGGQLYGLNAGEVVLNRSQVNNLASALTGNGDGGGMYSTPYVQGEMIFLGVNNYLKRSGRGEIVTSKRG